MVLKSARLPVDMLSQILYDKTVDVGKIYVLLIQNNIFINNKFYRAHVLKKICPLFQEEEKKCAGGRWKGHKKMSVIEKVKEGEEVKEFMKEDEEKVVSVKESRDITKEVKEAEEKAGQVVDSSPSQD